VDGKIHPEGEVQQGGDEAFPSTPGTHDTLADPGWRTRRPPNGRGPMIFYAQYANFSQFFLRSLRSRIILSILLIVIWSKTR